MIPPMIVFGVSCWKGVRMQHKIKFRAWDKEKKAWIRGAYGFHILGESMLIGGLFQDYSLPDLNNIIIEQFTGLCDKNGKGIYEGDIVELDYASRIWKLEVRWAEHMWAWSFYCPHSKQYKHKMFMSNGYTTKIIGNIHENPKLLEDNDAND